MLPNTVFKMDLDLQHQPMGAEPNEPLYLLLFTGEFGTNRKPD